MRGPGGWRLAPAFDLNPAREMREHATAIDGRTITPTATDLMNVRAQFGLTAPAAREVVTQVAEAISGWNDVARAAGIGANERRVVGVAFSALDTVTDL